MCACVCVCVHMYVCCSHGYLNYKSSGVANPHTYAVYPPQVSRAAQVDYKGTLTLALPLTLPLTLTTGGKGGGGGLQRRHGQGGAPIPREGVSVSGLVKLVSLLVS